MQKIPSSFVEQSTHINSFLSKMHTKILEYPFKLDIPPPSFLYELLIVHVCRGLEIHVGPWGHIHQRCPLFLSMHFSLQYLEQIHLYHCGCFPHPGCFSGPHSHEICISICLLLDYTTSQLSSLQSGYPCFSSDHYYVTRY